MFKGFGLVKLDPEPCKLLASTASLLLAIPLIWPPTLTSDGIYRPLLKKKTFVHNSQQGNCTMNVGLVVLVSRARITQSVKIANYITPIAPAPTMDCECVCVCVCVCVCARAIKISANLLQCINLDLACVNPNECSPLLAALNREKGGA